MRKGRRRARGKQRQPHRWGSGHLHRSVWWQTLIILGTQNKTSTQKGGNDLLMESVLKKAAGLNPFTSIYLSIHSFIHPSHVCLADVFIQNGRGGLADVAPSTGSRQVTGDLIDCWLFDLTAPINVWSKVGNGVSREKCEWKKGFTETCVSFSPPIKAAKPWLEDQSSGTWHVRGARDEDSRRVELYNCRASCLFSLSAPWPPPSSSVSRMEDEEGTR